MEILLRPSVPEDVPVQRTLWSLSFGDERAYINNFYKNYYRPDRVLVLEVEGAVRAMTAWFSTVLSIPARTRSSGRPICMPCASTPTGGARAWPASCWRGPGSISGTGASRP